MKKLLFLLSLLLSSQLMAATCEWPQWNNFKSTYIENGRVIDGSDDRLLTTSEGQSYALFFALVANDQQAFGQILKWTQANLAGGDLTARLPAWLWGKKLDGQFGILDTNPASDSDLWIAYALGEAGRLWNNYYYQSLGYLLAARILREESVQIAGVGMTLLPAPKGFDLGEGSYRLNPSYVPLQLIARMKELYPQYSWDSMYQSSTLMLDQTLTTGFSPDWVTLYGKRFSVDNLTGPTGSYDAIRTYLWVGMLNEKNKEKEQLVKKMKPFYTAIERLGAPPREVDTVSGKYSQPGSAGFSAAALPLLASMDYSIILETQATRVLNELVTNRNDHYYDNVLSLFGLGWHNERFRFGEYGELQPAWVQQCQ